MAIPKKSQGLFGDILKDLCRRIDKLRFGEIRFRAGTAPSDRDESRRKKLKRLSRTISGIQHQQEEGDMATVANQ